MSEAKRAAWVELVKVDHEVCDFWFESFERALSPLARVAFVHMDAGCQAASFLDWLSYGNPDLVVQDILSSSSTCGCAGEC